MILLRGGGIPAQGVRVEMRGRVRIGGLFCLVEWWLPFFTKYKVQNLEEAGSVYIAPSTTPLRSVGDFAPGFHDGPSRERVTALCSVVSKSRLRLSFV